jgi:hypothetical protein
MSDLKNQGIIHLAKTVKPYSLTIAPAFEFASKQLRFLPVPNRFLPDL